MSARGDQGSHPWIIAPVVALAAFMEILDISIANVSLPHIAGDLSASLDESTWVLTSYLVTNAIVHADLRVAAASSAASASS